MFETTNLKDKLKLFLKIMLPIFISQLGLMLITFSDTVMAGRAGSSDLAGVAIGGSVWFPLFVLFSGILISITPLVSQLIGAKQKEKIPFTVQQGMYLSIALAIVLIILGFFFVDIVLGMLHLTADVEQIAKNYLIGISFGVVPLFVYTVIRSFIDALGATRVSMFITLISLPINVLFNYLFIFGKLGFPALGGAGTGYASSVTYWIIIIIAYYIVDKKEMFARFNIFHQWKRISFTAWKDNLKIGVPIGFSIFFEVSIFTIVTMLMSTFSTNTIAAHQAAINFASLIYMVPLSISMALTIAVGYEVGAKRFHDAKQYAIIGISSSLFVALFTAVGLFIFNSEVASLYTKDAELLALIKHFLIYAIFFQFADAIGGPVQGALRGYKDVNITLIMTFVSYWIIGLPAGYAFAHFTTLGPYGYWVGLITGLTVGAIALSTRLIIVQRKHVNQLTA
jgi:multidrug resistance protein, MATE family